MSETNAGSSVFFNPQRRGFGTASPVDESMHWDAAGGLAEPTAIETQFFGFNVPEANVNAFTYMWAHPNLGVMSGGVWAWQGIKPDALASELFDIRDFQADEAIRLNDIGGYEMENGYRVDVIEPLEKIRIRYDDPSRANRFDVTLTAIMPPAMVAGAGHFDQAMRTEGDLLLRGKPFTVAGYHVRDRSWGETRVEVPRPVPPLYWVTPVFGDDFALNITAVDDPRRNPLWSDVYDFDPEQAAALNRGWVWRDGDLFDVTNTSITTQWDRVTGYPVEQRIEVADRGGREFTLAGTVTAACNWHVYSNVRVGFCLARWECGGRVGWGETQAVAWTDFFYELMR